MSGQSNIPRPRTRSSGPSQVSPSYPRRRPRHEAEHGRTENTAPNIPPLRRSLSQASTLYPLREQTHFDLGEALIFRENPLPPNVPPPQNANPVPDKGALRIRERNATKTIGDTLFPRIVDSGIEPGQFYRKRAGQRFASAPQPEEQANVLAPTRTHSLTNNPNTANRRSVFLIPTREGTAQQASHFVEDHPAAGKLFYVYSQQPGQLSPNPTNSRRLLLRQSPKHQNLIFRRNMILFGLRKLTTPPQSP